METAGENDQSTTSRQVVSAGAQERYKTEALCDLELLKTQKNKYLWINDYNLSLLN